MLAGLTSAHVCSNSDNDSSSGSSNSNVDDQLSVAGGPGRLLGVC
jgi:hypothetical protein